MADPIPNNSTAQLDLLVPGTNAAGTIYSDSGLTWHFNIRIENYKQSIVRSPVLFGLPTTIAGTNNNPLVNLPHAFVLDLGMLQETWEINGVIDDNETDNTYATYDDLSIISRVAGTGASGTPSEQSSTASPAAGAGVRLTLVVDPGVSPKTLVGDVMFFECNRDGGNQYQTYIMRIGLVKWNLNMVGI